MMLVSDHGPDAVARRVARDLDAGPQGKGARCWVAPELGALRLLVADRLTAEAGDADVVVLAAELLAETGEVSCPGAPRPRTGARILAVLQPSSRIVRRCAASSGRAERAFGALGVLEVTSAGLVIVELARGVSAVDLQARAEPTLKICPHVCLMDPVNKG